MDERKWYDWSDAVEVFAEALENIRTHILDHNLIMESEEVGENMQKAITFLRDHDNLSWENEKWNEGWDFIRDNLRAWWD